MAHAEAPGRSMSRQRPWLSMLLRFLLIAVAAAPAWSLSQGAGPVEERSRTDTERAPTDAPSLWLHCDGSRESRIVLETSNGVYVREWRSPAMLDESTRHEVRAALDAMMQPSRAVMIKVRPEVPFRTLKGLMLAVGAKEPAGYRTYVEVVAQFPVRVLRPRR